MTFGELKTAIGTWLAKGDNNLPDEVRGQIINMAIREYCGRYDLRFGEYTADVSALATIPYSNLPTGFKRPFQMWYLTAINGLQHVDYLDREEFLIRYPDSTQTGDVKHYTIWAGKIWWGPTPATNKTIKFDIYRYLTDLSGSSETNDFTLYVWPLLLFKCCCLASLFGIEDARMQSWQTSVVPLESQMVSEHARARSTGRRPETRDFGYIGKP
jgi:hypothetical protein